MKKAKLILCVVIACALCMFWSCKKEEPYGQIQGIVTNASTNEPIQGVNISLSPTGLSAVTGSDGRYEFNDLEADHHRRWQDCIGRYDVDTHDEWLPP